MSVNLHWYRPPTERKALGSGGMSLKYILAQRYHEGDGSTHAEFTLSAKDIPFIEGLVAAGVEDSKKLLTDLRQYGTLDVDFS